ncbi:MAG TPA: hypothetical protein VGG41_16180 [Solirubrobacteraceae bacterium]|jgi:hypothetical protein
MKRSGFVAVLLAALVLCASALASSGPSGAYSGTVKSGNLKGSWTLSFSSPNYTVALNGSVVVKGSYSISGSKLTLTDKSGKLACPGKGVYSFKLSGRSLSLKKVSDTNAKCAGRRAVLAIPFTKKFSQAPGGGY